jgi:hypothetical protein
MCCSVSKISCEMPWVIVHSNPPFNIIYSGLWSQPYAIYWGLYPMAKVPYPIPVSIRSEPIHAGPGGLEHGFYFVPFHIWDVIRNPLTNSIIFQDCRYTTNQLSYFFFRIKRWKAPSLFNSWLCYQRCFIVLHGIRLALPRRAGQSPWPAMEMVGFSSHVRWDRKSMRTTTSNRDVLACPIFRHSFFSFFLFLFALACSCATDVLIGCEHFI